MAGRTKRPYISASYRATYLQIAHGTRVPGSLTPGWNANLDDLCSIYF